MMRHFKIIPALVYLTLFVVQDATVGEQVSRSSADSITAICMTPDDKLLSASDHGLYLRGTQAFEVLKRIECPLEKIYAIKFSPSNQSVAVAGGTPAAVGAIAVYSFPAFELLNHIECHQDVATDVAWLDRFVLVSCSSSGSCCRIDLTKKNKPVSKPVHSSGVLAIEILDKRTIVSAGQDNAIRVWQSDIGNDSKKNRSLNNHTATVNDLDVNRFDAHAVPIMVASASDDFTIRFWQPVIGRMVRFARLESKPNCVIWDRTGDLVIAGCRNGRIYLIRKANAKIIRSIESNVGWINGLALSADGKRLFVGGVDGMAAVNIQ